MSVKVLELEENGGFAGMHIMSVCEKAAAKATSTSRPVHFEFNGTHVIAQPGESAKTLEDRWSTDFEAAAKAYREDPQRKVEQAEREEKDRQARAAHMTESASGEVALREAKVPWPLTPAQLTEYIESLVHRTHDYGTCCYAMSMAAEAAFNYVAGTLGVTGFQASCADLDFIRRTRHMAGPFILLKAEDMLYPQYDLNEKLSEAMAGWKPWLKEQAKKRLTERHEHVHPAVLEHWKKLAEGRDA